jgi:hypothetical protein
MDSQATGQTRPDTTGHVRSRVVPKPSRTVTRAKCVTCGKSFVSSRADARYCSGRCRQRANRARQTALDIDRAIDEARRLYWSLIRRKAEAQGRTVGAVLTDEAVTVRDGYVYKGGIGSGECIGTTTEGHPGWDGWGIEAAGPPFNPPPTGPQERTHRIAHRAPSRDRRESEHSGGIDEPGP